jgi:uncharacterized membrane protein YqiK
VASPLKRLEKIQLMFVIIAATILVLILVILFFVNRAPKNTDDKKGKMQ